MLFFPIGKILLNSIMDDKMSSQTHVTKYCKLKTGAILNNKYRVLERIGKGRFSIVYCVEDISTSKQYAVKVYRRGSSNKQYFDNEYGIAKTLSEHRFDENSKYVVNFVDAFAHLHTKHSVISLHPCITYTLLGDTLRDLLDYVQGGMPLPTVKKMTREVLLGLSFIHKCGIIHTDIKSSNVLLTKTIEDIHNNDEISVVIADVGSATFADNLFSHRIGTQEYLSPEALFCLDFGPPTDIWSTMCLVYEMTTGDYLFNIDEFDEELLEDSTSSPDNMSDSEVSSGVSSDGDSERVSGSHRGGNSDDRELNRKHLILMESLLGPLPSRLTKKDAAKQYYNNRGKLIHNPKITSTSIREMISRDFEYISEEDCAGVESFILSGLKYIPEERPTCSQLIDHPWLKN